MVAETGKREEINKEQCASHFGNFSPENCDVGEVEVGRAEQRKHSIQITLRVKRATPLLAPGTSVVVLEIPGDSPTLS